MDLYCASCGDLSGIGRLAGDEDRQKLTKVVELAIAEAMARGISELRDVFREELSNIARAASPAFKSGFASKAEQPEDDPNGDDNDDWCRRPLRAYSRFTEEEQQSLAALRKKRTSERVCSASPKTLGKVAPEPSNSAVVAWSAFAGVVCTSEIPSGDSPESLPQSTSNADYQLATLSVNSANGQENGDIMAMSSSGSVAEIVGRNTWQVAQTMRGTFARVKTQAVLLDNPSTIDWMRKVVTSSKFELCMCMVILVNALTLGAQTDYVARHQSNVVPDAFAYVESCLCLIFVVELLVRLVVFKWRFFVRTGWQWNVFDCLVVGVQVVEQVFTVYFSGKAQVVNNLSSARAMRFLRLIRVLRVARVLQGISELRILVVSILSSMRALLWTMVLMLLMIFTLGIYLTQLVSDHRQTMDPETEAYDMLGEQYGSMGSTMFVMFMSVTGGADWGTYCEPLMDEVSPWVAMVFTLYVAFMVLAMLNVVTGVFVESVLKSQASDRDMVMVNNARELFMTLDDGIHATMTWDTFKSKLQEPQMVEFFKFIDVDPSEAKGLFKLLDLDESGGVSAEEFLNGAIRLRGHAKSLDVALLLQEVKQMQTRLP